MGLWRIWGFGGKPFPFPTLCLGTFDPILQFRRCSVRLHPCVSSTFGEKAVDLKAWDAVGVNASGLGAKTIELIML